MTSTTIFIIKLSTGTATSEVDTESKCYINDSRHRCWNVCDSGSRAWSRMLTADIGSGVPVAWNVAKQRAEWSWETSATNGRPGRRPFQRRRCRRRQKVGSFTETVAEVERTS